jgi:hypothetical protein
MRIVFLVCLFSICLINSYAQSFKSDKELRRLNNTYKANYFDELSRDIDTLSYLKSFVDSGYIFPNKIPPTSPIHKMLEYFKRDIATLDSFAFSKGDTSDIYVINLSDSIFFKNVYYSKAGKILKIENTFSVQYFKNEASIYFKDDKPYKVFWVNTKEPYMGVEMFYYFKGKNISNNSWEDFKAYSSFEYQRAINLLEDYKKQFTN